MARSEPLKGTGAHKRRGFTLLEVLVALGVVSVAAWIFISLFTSSLFFSNLSRSHRVAAGLAEEQLAQAVRDPGRFVWDDLAKMEPGKPVKLKLRADNADGPYPVGGPQAEALSKPAQKREENFYGAFTWQPYAVLPPGDKPYLELVAVVQWKVEGKDYSLSLTSAVPRAQVEGRS